MKTMNYWSSYALFGSLLESRTPRKNIEKEYLHDKSTEGAEKVKYL